MAKIRPALLCVVILIGCDCAKADFEAGQSLEAQQEFVAAGEAYKHAVASDPTSRTGRAAAERLAALAKVHFEEGQYFEKHRMVISAGEAYQHAVASDPDSAEGKAAAQRLADLSHVIATAKAKDWCYELMLRVRVSDLGPEFWNRCRSDRVNGERQEDWKCWWETGSSCEMNKRIADSNAQHGKLQKKSPPK